MSLNGVGLGGCGFLQSMQEICRPLSDRLMITNRPPSVGGLVIPERTSGTAPKRGRFARWTFDIDGNWIARGKCLIEGLVKEFLHVRYCDCRRPMQCFSKRHDLDAFFFT